MLKLRLSMGGTKKRPVYKIVVADSRFARDGRFIEKLGFFNPLLPKEKKERIKLESERVKHWLSKGARPTVRVSRILGEVNIMPMPKPGNNPHKAIPKKDRKKDGKEDVKTAAPKVEAPKQEVKKEEKKPLPEILVEAGTDAYDDDSIKEPQAAEGALEEMTKAELLDWALKQGHDLPNNDLKSEIFARCKEIKAGF